MIPPESYSLRAALISPFNSRINVPRAEAACLDNGCQPRRFETPRFRVETPIASTLPLSCFAGEIPIAPYRASHQ